MKRWLGIGAVLVVLGLLGVTLAQQRDLTAGKATARQTVATQAQPTHPAGQQTGPNCRHRPPPDCLVLEVLDANHDGELSPEEIANASAALLTLDANGDGTLSWDELHRPPPRPMACCLPDGTCQDLPPRECIRMHGIPQGPGSTCATTNCQAPPPPQPVACCFADGTCQDLTPRDCFDAGGHPQGPGSTCATADCQAPPPPPTVACCLPDGTCQDLAPRDCRTAGGRPQGPGTSCATADCSK